MTPQGRRSMPTGLANDEMDNSTDTSRPVFVSWTACALTALVCITCAAPLPAGSATAAPVEPISTTQSTVNQQSRGDSEWTTRVTGRLHPVKIQAVVRANFWAFRSCYESGRERVPGLAGGVTVAFRISETGHVDGAKSEHGTLPDQATVSCIVAAFASLQFPPPEAGVVDVSYPLRFASSSAR